MERHLDWMSLPDFTKQNLMDYEKVAKAYRMLKALEHPLSRRIMNILQDGPKDVTEIWIALRHDHQSVVSEKLGKLKRAGAVDYEKEGKHHLYYLSANIENINQSIKTFNHEARSHTSKV